MNVPRAVEFFEHLDKTPELNSKLSGSSSISEIIGIAGDAGFHFSEDDLRGALNKKILDAASLPRPWGWKVARELGLVRSGNN